MMKIGKDELTCDMAETYRIYDMTKIKPSMLATLAAGLRQDSRIMLKLSGAPIDFKTQLLASIMDGINILIWQKTKDGAKNQNRPKSVLNELTRDHSRDVKGFDNVDDFLYELERY
jgi:hypothetical protein